MRLRTHFGAGMYGRTSVRCRTISNDADPEPITTPACSTSAGTPLASRISPTSTRERRCADSGASSGCNPPRYTMRETDAAAAASATVRAARRSVSSKSRPPPIEWMR